MSDNTDLTVIEKDDAALPVVSIFDALETDTDATENGRWFEGDEVWGPKLAHVSIKLRRMTSKASQKARRDVELKYAKYQDKKGQFPEDVSKRLLAEHLATGIIVDWKGVIDRDGKEIPFSPEAAFALAYKLPDFMLPLVQKSAVLDSFQAEAKEIVEGN